MNIFALYISLYGILALSHIFLQMYFAHREHRRQESRKFLNYHKHHKQSVTVVVPCYNEDPSLLDRCLESISSQTAYEFVHTIVVDDGSKNREELLPVLNKYSKAKTFEIILLPQHSGKRVAQKMAFDKAKGDIIVTVDSDTVIEVPNGIDQIVKQFKNSSIGAVTGDVRVSNKNENFLTHLISYRYWTAFNQERAAQSNFNVLMCCSGPFSAYRREVIDKIKEQYISQRFLGHQCTFGDDRHLTNLVLQEGHRVVFDKRAIAYTHVPNTIKKYIKQQVRWNKSFYREMLWTLKNVHKHHVYMLYDLIMQLVLPFMLVIALASIVYQTIFMDVTYLFRYLAILIAIAVVRAFYGIYRTKDFGFLRFVTYGFMHVFILIPSRFYALATIYKNGWNTR